LCSDDAKSTSPARDRSRTENCGVSRARRPDLALVPDLGHELDELYGVAFGEFTAARNELAKRLRKAGQNEEAEKVAALSKPSISAWAINRLARAQRERMQELLDAGQEIVEAQKEALAGKGAERFDEASRRQREAVRGLVRPAESVLVEAGHRPSEAVKERISSSLRAASMDPEGRVLLEQGRFTEDFESAGLGLLAGLAPPKRARTPRSDRAQRQARLREARAALETARKEERRLSEEAAAAEEESERAAERARALAAEAESAREAVEAAEQALHALEDE
jgi:hypothetical protein